jgi:hypothetical protein
VVGWGVYQMGSTCHPLIFPSHLFPYRSIPHSRARRSITANSLRRNLIPLVSCIQGRSGGWRRHPSQCRPATTSIWCLEPEVGEGANMHDLHVHGTWEKRDRWGANLLFDTSGSHR